MKSCSLADWVVGVHLARSVQCRGEGGVQSRQHIGGKPRVGSLPRRCSPRWVRQRKLLWQKVAELAHPIRHRPRSFRVYQGVGAHEKREADCGHGGDEPMHPQRCALRARRCVASVWQATRVAKSHWHDSDTGFVIEQGALHLQPAAQPIAGWVVPGNAACMHLGAGSLPDDEHACRGRSTEHRPRPERKELRTSAAGARCRGDVGQRFSQSAPADAIPERPVLPASPARVP